MKEVKVPAILNSIDYSLLSRIDLALEGNWNSTVRVLWTKEKCLAVIDCSDLTHEWMKPSIELYFKSEWIGIHCYKQANGKNVYDADCAREIINYIEKKLDKID